MIIDCIEMAKKYSSSGTSQRGNEEIPQMQLNDKVAASSSGPGITSQYTTIDPDATFGWDGDVWAGPWPKLDPNYGEEFGNEMLAGEEGQHGGHLWSFEQSKVLFESSENKDEAWALLEYLQKSFTHVAPITNGQPYAGGVPVYSPLVDQVLDEYEDEMQQPLTLALEFLTRDYADNFQVTGGSWDVSQTGQIRWQDLNETISQAIAGDHKVNETPSVIRDRVEETLSG